MTRPDTLQPDEEILKQERLHSGIFALPILVFIALLVPAMPLFFFLRMTASMLAQLNPQGSPSGFPLLWLLLIALGLLPAFVVFLLTLIAYLNCQITLTNKRLIYRRGFLVRAAGELPLENIEAIFILEPLLGRLLGYGTVTVSSLGGLRLPLQYLGKPHVFHALLQRAVADAKKPAKPVVRPASAVQDDSRYMPKA